MQNNWHKFIPKEGILCYVWDTDRHLATMDIVIGYSTAYHCFIGSNELFAFAEPVSSIDLANFKEALKKLQFSLENS